MASTKQLLDKFIVLMHDLENEEFKDGRHAMIYCGKQYTINDFRNMERAVRQVQKTYQVGVDKSSRYLKKNKEYNRTLRMINYYKIKKNKTIKDFEKLEELQKEFDRIVKERDEMKLENAKNKVIQNEIEKQKSKFMEDMRYFDEV